LSTQSGLNDLRPGNAVKVKSALGLFKGEKLGVVIEKCKGVQGWMVRLSNPESATSTYCISTERGDTIIRITK
jgi:hypothetical protein